MYNSEPWYVQKVAVSSPESKRFCSCHFPLVIEMTNEPDDTSIDEILDHSWWRQRIPLDSNHITPGRMSSAWNSLNLPEDMSGKSMIIIGAFDGMHAFEAESRGASRVMATDIWHASDGWGDVNTKKSFDLVHNYLDSDVESKSISVYDLSVDDVGKFDICLADSVVTWLDHPYLGIKKMASITNDTLVAANGLCQHSCPHPCLILEYYDGWLNDGAGDQLHWGIDEDCYREMLTTAGFSKIKVWENPYQHETVRGEFQSDCKLYEDHTLNTEIEELKEGEQGVIMHHHDNSIRVKIGNQQGWVPKSKIKTIDDKLTTRMISAYKRYSVTTFVRKSANHTYNLLKKRLGVETNRLSRDAMVIHAEK